MNKLIGGTGCQPIPVTYSRRGVIDAALGGIVDTDNTETREKVLGPDRDPELVYNEEEGVSRGNPIYSH